MATTRLGPGGYPVAAKTAGVTAYTLACAVGLFVLTGEDVGLKAARTVAPAAGSFVLTGENVGLVAARKVAPAAGSFVLTGENASLIAIRKVAPAAGSFVLTGEPAGLVLGRKIAPSPGLFTLTGESVDFVRSGRKLDASPGIFTLTGQGASFVFTRLLSAEPGMFVLVGQDIQLRTTLFKVPPPDYLRHSIGGTFVGEDFAERHATQSLFYGFDLSRDLLEGEFLASAIWTCTADADPNAATLLVGMPVNSQTKTKQEVGGGIPGVAYVLTATITTNMNRRFPRWSYAPCV